MKARVAVVGGGASGMMAAIWAKRMGAEVKILERNPRVGKKILATGNGRCNISNIYCSREHYHGEAPNFVVPALSAFDVKRTLAFFEKLGITPKVEESGKVFPMSDQASSVLDVLLYELQELNIDIQCNAFVKDIKRRKGGFLLELDGGNSVSCEKLILACGGKAMPSSGSDGNGFELARKLGHHIVDIFPALTQLKLEGDFFKQIDGVKFVGTAEILSGGKALAADRGDILFTNYGISGPPILQISRMAGELLKHNQKAVLKITMFDMKKNELDDLLARRFANKPARPLDLALVGLINKRLIPVVLKQAGIRDLKLPAGKLTAQDRNKIASILTDWRFSITGLRSWPNAQVTAGGVDTDEVNPYTMESKLVPGLYFCGEILDVDGECGGFNLQWAWSSGYVAGVSAAK